MCALFSVITEKFSCSYDEMSVALATMKRGKCTCKQA